MVRTLKSLPQLHWHRVHLCVWLVGRQKTWFFFMSCTAAHQRKKILIVKQYFFFIWATGWNTRGQKKPFHLRQRGNSTTLFLPIFLYFFGARRSSSQVFHKGTRHIIVPLFGYLHSKFDKQGRAGWTILFNAQMFNALSAPQRHIQVKMLKWTKTGSELFSFVWKNLKT